MELLIINATYVAYRLLVTANVIRFLNQYMNYYVAVLVAAQVSFAYDNGLFAVLFDAQQLPSVANLLYADLTYTLRVIAAWWLIKQIQRVVNNYYFAVFIGAEITFVADYFIFDGIVY
jgi:hypothetical protein